MVPATNAARRKAFNLLGEIGVPAVMLPKVLRPRRQDSGIVKVVEGPKLHGAAIDRLEGLPCVFEPPNMWGRVIRHRRPLHESHRISVW
jgi:hypothetical protein